MTLAPSLATRRLDPAVLATIAAGLAAVTVPWELHAGETPHHRRYERVLATSAYDVWVICWPPGGELDLHDHGTSAGALSVVAGELEETAVAGGGLLVRHLRAGRTVSFAPGHIHAMANPATRPATSVHVYSPPLSDMGFYDRAGDGALVARPG